MSEELQDKGISRRSAIKRIGAGAALVWAAPAITSVGSASAQPYPGACADPPCGTHGCPDVVVCGQAGASDLCVCNRTVEGVCACSEIVPCDDPRFHACTASTDCDPGLRCVVVSGCNANCQSAICLPDCGTSGLAAGAGGGTGNSLGT